MAKANILFVVFFITSCFMITTCTAEPDPEEYPDSTDFQDHQCPIHCVCTKDLVTCGRGKLSHIPHPLPTTIDTLEIRDNNIRKIAGDDLDDLDNLQTLILFNNGIIDIEPETFDSLQYLQKLKLNRNNLNSLPSRVFHYLTDLRSLELNSNIFTKIESLMFQGLKSLQTLKMRNNLICELGDGAFFNLSTVNNLHLDNNAIEEVRSAFLFSLTNLKNLTLSHNKIHTIQNSSWEYTKNLTHIDLSYNSLTTIDKKTFANLPHLKRLNLNNNQISRIEEFSFNETTELQILFLRNNLLKWPVEDVSRVFSNLMKLEVLDLSSNSFTSVSTEAFTDLHSLRILDLSNNDLIRIEENAFDNLNKLQIISMNTNNLLCDCELEYLHNWLYDKRFISSSTVKAACMYPPELAGQQLAHFDSDRLVCDMSQRLTIIEEPKNQTNWTGQNVTLTCSAVTNSDEKMAIFWRKDRKDLNITHQTVYSAKSIENVIQHTSELVIKNVTKDYSGVYQCIAENKYGTTYSKNFNFEVLVYPNFVHMPLNVTISAGGTAKLECSADGDPRPQISWKKDGGEDFPAARERRMHVMKGDKNFYILNAKFSDQGIYTCTAESSIGKIIASAYLEVTAAPVIRRPMENKEIGVGESTIFECDAIASPEPEVVWLKDGNPITLSPRHYLTSENQVLVLANAETSDAGHYVCEVINSLGTARDSARLTIIPNTSTVNTGEIIGYVTISVAFCAVFTSVCWVFFIYYTRMIKRREAQIAHMTPVEIVHGADDDDDDDDDDDPSLDQLEIEMELNLKNKKYFDNISEKSIGRDSGTGDSAERSSDDLLQVVISHGRRNLSDSMLDLEDID